MEARASAAKSKGHNGSCYVEDFGDAHLLVACMNILETFAQSL